VLAGVGSAVIILACVGDDPRGSTPVEQRPDASTSGGPDASLPLNDGGPDAPAPFDPATVSGLCQWLDGERGVELVDGNVTVWRDQSGAGRDLLAAGPSTEKVITAEKFPSASRQAIRFTPRTTCDAALCDTVLRMAPRDGGTASLQQPLTIALVSHN